MITVSHLSKAFRGSVVLDDVSVTIGPGEIFVIVGESGAGKSVLLKHIVGLIHPDSGTIEIDGVAITNLRERALLEVRKNIGYLFQEGALYDFMTVFENVAFPLREHTRLKAGVIAQKVREMLSLVDIEGAEEKYPSELSGGMKKRVALARALIMNSTGLLCDEPTSGLDPIRSRDISDLIKNMSRRLKCTTVITSHDIKNAFRIADRVGLLKDGKLAAVGSEAELRQLRDPFVKEFIS